jgi:hypothetical protein
MSANRSTTPTEPTPRGCLHCGKHLGPSNKSGYCSEHHRPCDREKRFCRECQKRLRSDTPDDYCLQCRLSMQAAIEPQICKADGCNKELRRDNQTGLCPAHHYFVELHPSGKVCAEPGCGNHLKVSNASGYCPDHRWLKSRTSIKTRICAKAGCEKELRSDNKTGYCRDHTHLSYLLPLRKCEAAGCSNTIGHASESGLCHTHFGQRYQNENREAANRRMAAFRARQLAKLAEAERIAALPRGGRTREDEDRASVLKLKEQGLSWEKIAMVMNKKTRTNRTAEGYRSLARRT